MGALNSVLQAAYAGILAGNMLWAVFVIHIVNFLPLSTAQKQGCCLMIVQAAWRAAFFFSPWVRLIESSDSSTEWSQLRKITAKADEDQAKDGGAHRPVFILGNHTCFIDTVLATAKFPAYVLWRCRTYMDNGLFKLPILGTICKSAGHFPVHFASGEDGVFKVDNKKMEIVDQNVNEHLKNGGWLCFFPEGQMNKTPDKLMPLRFGGLKKALEFDARLVAFIAHGNTTVWPKKAQVGGFPGSIRYSTKVLAPDGCKAYVEQVRAENVAEERDLPDHELLARRLGDSMQQQYDELKAGKAIGTKVD